MQISDNMAFLKVEQTEVVPGSNELVHVDPFFLVSYALDPYRQC